MIRNRIEQAFNQQLMYRAQDKGKTIEKSQPKERKQEAGTADFTVVSDPDVTSLDIDQKSLINFIDETMEAEEIQEMVLNHMQSKKA